MESHIVPRVSAAHEQEIRRRIVDAAVSVFSQKGYRGATVADVVRESGLSVGAIYTYFASKEALFFEMCDLASARGIEELGKHLAGAQTTAEKLALAISMFIETVDTFEGEPGQVTLVAAWAEAEAEPLVREMLVRRRERLVGVGHVLLQEGIAKGELPAWLDVDAVARGLTALLDGLLLQRIEAGASYRQVDLQRRAVAMLDL